MGNAELVSQFTLGARILRGELHKLRPLSTPGIASWLGLMPFLKGSKSARLGSRERW